MKIWIIDLESVPTRYTCQWKTHVPELIKQFLTNSGEYDSVIEVIEGPGDIPAATTPGAFLNFGGTNIYKSAQIEKLSRYVTEGLVKSGDHILFTDAWNPGIIQVKYMMELLGIKTFLHGIWHAGSYDPQDFLGRLIGNKPWVRHAEESFFNCYDHNYFATNFHINIFKENLLKNTEFNNKIVRSGLPFEYLKSILKPFADQTKKKDLIVFPHRIAPEKQLEIFEDLALAMPSYEWVICQNQNLTKDEYHEILSEAKIVFSANLQETLGISMMEGMLVGAHPMVPDRLSYSEMYPSKYKYPNEWTTDFDSYIKHKDTICAYVSHILSTHNFGSIIADADQTFSKYFTSTELLYNLRQRTIQVDHTNDDVLKS